MRATPGASPVYRNRVRCRPVAIPMDEAIAAESGSQGGSTTWLVGFPVLGTGVSSCSDFLRCASRKATTSRRTQKFFWPTLKGFGNPDVGSFHHRYSDIFETPPRNAQVW